MPTDLLEAQRLSRSVVRHRPIAPDAVNTQVKTPRASRARQHHEPHTTGGPPSVAARPAHRSKAHGTWLIYVVLGMLMAMVLLWLGQIVLNWATTLSDDLRYGRPRTTNVDHVVGHETGKTVTHFTALNLNVYAENRVVHQKIDLYTEKIKLYTGKTHQESRAYSSELASQALSSKSGRDVFGVQCTTLFSLQGHLCQATVC